MAARSLIVDRLIQHLVRMAFKENGEAMAIVALGVIAILDIDILNQNKRHSDIWRQGPKGRKIIARG